MSTPRTRRARVLGMVIVGMIERTREYLLPALALRLAAEIMFAVAPMAPLAETVG